MCSFTRALALAAVVIRPIVNSAQPHCNGLARDSVAERYAKHLLRAAEGGAQLFLFFLG
jgi:hypothetical protein